LGAQYSIYSSVVLNKWQT